MGIFVTADGQHYKGWLAGLLCCCAAVNEDEHPGEWASRADNSQPQPIQPPAYAYVAGDQQRAGSDDSERALLKAPPPMPTTYDQGSNDPISTTTTTHLHPIGSPTSAFRRLDPTERQSNGLVPLKLAPVMLRSPRSDDDVSHAEDDQKHSSRHPLPHTHLRLLSTESSNSFRDLLEAQYQRSRERNAEMRHLQLLTSIEQPGIEDVTQSRHDQQLEATLSISTSSSSLRTPTRKDSASSLTTRSSHDLSPRLRTKHSGAVSPFRDDTDLGIELNTIHEDDKLESRRPLTARSEGHVPAVAPTMQVHARSETLTDIGSIFSRPLELKNAKAFDEMLAASDERHARSSGEESKLRSRSGSRVSGWLNNIRAPGPVAIAHTGLIEHVSERSSASPRSRPPSRVSKSSVSATTIETLPTTAAGSPTTKTHGKNTTAGSRMTSPRSAIREPTGDERTYRARFEATSIGAPQRQCQDERWPTLVHTSDEVGVAY